MARSAVERSAPDEVEDFDLVIRAFARNPGAARAAFRPANEPTASAGSTAVDVASTIAMAVATDIVKDLLVAQGRNLAKRYRLRRRFTGWRWRREATPETEVPPVTEAEVPGLERQARAAAHRLGVASQQAEPVTTALVASWPRMPS